MLILLEFFRDWPIINIDKKKYEYYDIYVKIYL
jgi:hypothetical protein